MNDHSDQTRSDSFGLSWEVLSMAEVLKFVSGGLMNLSSEEITINVAGAVSWILDQVVENLQTASERRDSHDIHSSDS
ncbi:MAG: hypothetical protein AB7S77_19245 [Desulfatirhabdiaceae bacterium]